MGNTVTTALIVGWFTYSANSKFKQRGCNSEHKDSKPRQRHWAAHTNNGAWLGLYGHVWAYLGHNLHSEDGTFVTIAAIQSPFWFCWYLHSYSVSVTVAGAETWCWKCPLWMACWQSGGRGLQSPGVPSYQMAVATIFSLFTHLAKSELPLTQCPQEKASTERLPSLLLPRLWLPSSARLRSLFQKEEGKKRGHWFRPQGLWGITRNKMTR